MYTLQETHPDIAVWSAGRVVFGLSVGRGPGMAARVIGAKIKTTSVCLRQEHWFVFGSRTLWERRAVQSGVVTRTPPPHVALLRMVYYIYLYTGRRKKTQRRNSKILRVSGISSVWVYFSLFFFFYLSEIWVLVVSQPVVITYTQQHYTETLEFDTVNNNKKKRDVSPVPIKCKMSDDLLDDIILYKDG